MLRKGCDSYSPAPPRTMTALGLDFAMRYVGLGSGKLLTAPEVRALHDAGKDILLNPELDTTDGAGGFAQGVRYANIANDHADALGAPQTAVLVFSIDANRTADWVRPYFEGVASVKRRLVGGYGGTEMVAMLNEGLITVWDQANAGSWSGWNTSNFPTHPRAHLRQHLPTTCAGFNYDPQDQCYPSDQCGFWLSPANIPDPPHPDVIPPEVPDVLQLVQFEVTVKAAPATRPDVKVGDLAVCFADGRNFWWVPTAGALSDATGVVLPELGAKVVQHSPAGPVDDPFAFGAAGPANATTAQLLGLPFP